MIRSADILALLAVLGAALLGAPERVCRCEGPPAGKGELAPQVAPRPMDCAGHACCCEPAAAAPAPASTADRTASFGVAPCACGEGATAALPAIAGPGCGKKGAGADRTASPATGPATAVASVLASAAPDAPGAFESPPHDHPGAGPPRAHLLRLHILRI